MEISARRNQGRSELNARTRCHCGWLHAIKHEIVYGFKDDDGMYLARYALSVDIALGKSRCFTTNAFRELNSAQVRTNSYSRSDLTKQTSFRWTVVASSPYMSSMDLKGSIFDLLVNLCMISSCLFLSAGVGTLIFFMASSKWRL